MSGYGKARFPFNSAKELQDLKNKIANLRGLARVASTPQSIMAPIVPNASPSSDYQVNYLPTRGGAMSGAIAFNHRYATITASAIDLSSTGSAYSTLIYLTASGSGAVNLQTIQNAHDDGQFLILYNTYSGGTLTIKNGTGNITTGTGADVVLGTNGRAVLFFDPLAQFWNIITISTSGSTGANTALSNLTSPTAVNQDLQPQTDNVQSVGAAKRWNFVRAYNYSMGNPNYAIFQLSGIDFTLLGYTSASPPFYAGDTIIKGLFQVKHQSIDTPMNVTTGNGVNNYVTLSDDGGFLFQTGGGLNRFGIAAPNISYVGMEWPVTIKNSGSYSVDAQNGAGTDFMVKMNDPSFARNCTLPDATLYPGRIIIVKHAGSGFNVNVLTQPGQTIDGVASYTINTLYGGIMVMSDGNNWLVLSRVT